MLNLIILSLPLLALRVAAQSEAGPYGQCGGSNYQGPTACTSGWSCSTINQYYAQCTPGGGGGGGSPTAAPTSGEGSAQPSTAAASSPGTGATGSPTVNTASPAGSAVPTSLVSPWIWIRAVESPNYHSYLQAQPTLTPGLAYMDSYTSAGQFQVESGQLVMNTGSGGTPLYMNVEDPSDKTQRALHVYFNTTKNTYGSFAFSGDALQWTDPDVERPNLSAWYVCADQELYINTGAYEYQDPSGCADETIHFYNGATACGPSC